MNVLVRVLVIVVNVFGKINLKSKKDILLMIITRWIAA